MAPRFHELDALRAFAMFLGVVLHASLFLIPDAWPVEDAWAASTSPETNPYGYLLAAIHGFRMPVFFLLSGFFTAMLWERRGLLGLAMHRVRRIGLPLLLGCFTIIPINAWLFARSDFDVVDWTVVWLDGFQHLWFLWLLLILAGIFILAARFGVGFTRPLWWLAVPLTLLPQLMMFEPVFGPDTSDELIPNPVVLFYYALFFGFGAFFYRRNIAVRKWWAVALLPALTVVFLAGLVLIYEVQGTGAWVGASVLQTAYAWLMCFGTMGLFRWIAARERFWVRYLSDASYWIYLWHLPLVVGAQWLVVGWPISVHLKFLLICVAVSAVLLVVYRFGVRYTPVGAMLNGRRTRRSASPSLRSAGSNV